MEVVIPDCCNIGVVFRALLAVNAAVLTGILLQTNSVEQGLTEFVEASMLVELACLWSLFALCGVRRVLTHAGLMHGVTPPMQRLLCVLVPALVTGVIMSFLTSFDWFLSSFEHFTAVKGILTAALLGILFQHYFELRTRAFSPVLVEARLQALQARIRPHFLFNSLNAVLSLIRTEPKRAEAALEDLADLFRVLMSDPHSMTTMAREIELCHQYLSIEKIRLGERLQPRWEMEGISDEVLRKAQIPVLLLQPLLENAVHYGVEPASGPVEVQVHVSRSIDRIEVVVVNPYQGKSVAASGNHMALNNIRERLALLYDVEAQLTTTVGRGVFEVRLRFPYMKSPG
ncbi:sensor histidine kinase [Noviherbaspirillum massiliense]|uniref:sensor histidine kinase n=1 Tax=Noviherbaspirillum massiliense TaxID=1465823 RepID=UPI0003136B16|nr:histidine kinase [Noviherbaspirillum massiliense]